MHERTEIIVGKRLKRSGGRNKKRLIPGRMTQKKGGKRNDDNNVLRHIWTEEQLKKKLYE